MEPEARNGAVDWQWKTHTHIHQYHKFVMHDFTCLPQKQSVDVTDAS